MTNLAPAAIDSVALQELARSIRKELSRLDRRLKAIARDVERAQEAQALQDRAELLARNKLPKRGAHEVRVIDYALDPPQTVTITLDTTLEPRAQVDAWFKTARRYLRGAELGRQRAHFTNEDVAFLQTALVVVEGESPTQEAIAELVAEPRIARLTTSIRARQQPQQRAASSARRPYREFVGHGGARIWVGRGARDNDELTTRIARPQDLFLHVQGVTGSHVIVPRNKGELVATELLLDAAHLAHHFSSVASDTRSDVAYVERRYVQKRRGSPPGSVQLLRFKVLHLLVEPPRRVRLIEAEVRSP